MNIKEAIHMLKSYAGMTHKLTDNQGRPKLDQAIDTVLNELEKKDKVIDKMAGSLLVRQVIFKEAASREDIKEYFYKRVGEE